jgi:hypothetical protein
MKWTVQHEGNWASKYFVTNLATLAVSERTTVRGFRSSGMLRSFNAVYLTFENGTHRIPRNVNN